MRSRDVRVISQLCAETAEIPSPAAALDHFLEASARMLGADVVSLFGMHVEHTWYRGGAGMVRGFDDSQIALIQKWYFDSDQPIRCPLNEALYTQGHPSAVRSRRHLIDDGAWYRHPHTNERASQLGLDDVLLAVRPLGTEVVLFNLMRTCGSRPFSEEDEERIGLLSDLSRWFWEGLQHEGIVRAVHPYADLPPRLQKVLDQLLCGYSEKEMALRLGYKLNTLHRYVEQLYRRFGVSSRPELMARWIPRHERSYQPVSGCVVTSKPDR